MKKQTTKNRSSGKNHPPQDNGSADRLLDGYNRFYQTWSSLRHDLEDQIDQNLKRQQKMYDDFYGRWNRLAGEIGSRTGKGSMNEVPKEFYELWRNYANKIGPRLSRAVTDGLQSYGSMSASLDKYSKKMGEDVQGLLKTSWEPRNLEALYDTWLEFGSTLRKQMENAFEKGRGETDQLSKTWFEFGNRMQQLATSFAGKDGSYADTWNLWQKFSKDLGETMTGMVNGTSQDLEKLQKTWNDYYNKIEKEMKHLADEIGLEYEGLYSRFLQQQSKSLEKMSEWWLTASENARKELSALERRLLDLEKKVKETAK